MTFPTSAGTPLTRLVLFMVCISIAGTIVAGANFLAVSLPAQNAVQAPTNSYSETGGIQIWSNPGNSYVEISPNSGGMGYGGWTSSTGSYTLRDIPAYESYRVTVTKDGYRPYTTTLYVNPHIIAETNPTLQLDTPDPGNIDISITPYGGTVCVDGTQCESYDMDYNGQLSRQVRGLDGNQYHTVTVSMNGYRPFSKDVWVPAGDTAKLSTTMHHW